MSKASISAEWQQCQHGIPPSRSYLRVAKRAATATRRFEMKMPAIKMALAASVALMPLFSAGVANAQRYRAAPRSYEAAPRSYESNRDPRFTDEEQRIIDSISRNDRSAGY
jgi:hypothetical protein